MITVARLYATSEQAHAAIEAYRDAGIVGDGMAVLSPPTSQPAAAPTAPAVESTGAEGEAMAAPAPAPAPADIGTAVTAGRMLGRHSNFYISRVKQGSHLVVVSPHFIQSRAAELVLDAHDPLPDTHEPPRRQYVPVEQQATPFSDFLGISTLSRQAPVFSEAFGLKTLSSGTSVLSRMFPPRADNWTFSGMIGLGTKTKGATPLSSMTGMSTSSSGVAGKTSSFGIPLKTKGGTPLSSMFGLRVLSKKTRYLYDSY